jgi:hypothetical protein
MGRQKILQMNARKHSLNLISSSFLQECYFDYRETTQLINIILTLCGYAHLPYSMAQSLLLVHGVEPSDSPGAQYKASTLARSAQTLAEEVHNTQHGQMLSLTRLTLIGMKSTLVEKRLCDGLNRNGHQH